MHFPASIAFFGPESIAVMIPIVVLMIPIVAILTAHQQKMAQIIHGNNRSSELLDLRQELAELRSMVQRQSFAIDQLNSRVAIPKSADVDLPQRLRSEL